MLHRIIAQTLEARFRERVANEPEMVAHHCTAAGLHEQAVGYWSEAGRRAVERFANVDAIGHLGKGLEVLSPCGKPSCIGSMARFRWPRAAVTSSAPRCPFAKPSTRLAG